LHRNNSHLHICNPIGFKKTENKITVNFFAPVFTDLHNNITPENFKTPKLYHYSINSENRNRTEIVTDIKKTKYKEIKMNISSTQVIADLIKDIPLSTTVYILGPELLKSNKRKLTESDTCITKTKAKIIKTQHSSIPNFDHMVPQDTTISRISSKSFYTKQNNLTQFESTLVSTNVCPNTHIFTQYNPEIEISKIIESNMINYYRPSTPASIDTSINNPQVITTSELCYYSLSNQKTISTQYNTDIKKTKPKIMESTPKYIDLTVDSPSDMRASSVSPNMLNGQSSLTQSLTQLECYEPSTLASIDKTVNNLPIITNSRLSIEKNIFTEYNNGINLISSTSMSTDLRSNIPIFPSPSLRAITPNGNPALLGPPNVEVLMVGKDAKLTAIHSNRIKRADWKSPQNLRVVPQGISISSSLESALLPVAVKRALKPNSSPPSPPSKYPMLNKLLTRPINKILKLDKRNTLNTPANVSNFYFSY